MIFFLNFISSPGLCLKRRETQPKPLFPLPPPQHQQAHTSQLDTHTYTLTFCLHPPWGHTPPTPHTHAGHISAHSRDTQDPLPAQAPTPGTLYHHTQPGHLLSHTVRAQAHTHACPYRLWHAPVYTNPGSGTISPQAPRRPRGCSRGDGVRNKGFPARTWPPNPQGYSCPSSHNQPNALA